MDTVLRAGPADVIAYAFYRLGYRPRESLVLIGLRGPRLRVGLSIRMDLPGAPAHSLPLEFPLRRLREHGDDAVVALVVSDPGPGSPWPAHRRLVRELRHRLRAAGLTVMDVLAVGPTHWRSYLCQDGGCCPVEGLPLTLVTSSPLAAWMVSQGQLLAADEASMLAYVDPPPASEAAGPSVPAPAGGTAPPAPAPMDLPPREALARWLDLLHDDPRWAAEPPDPPPDVRWLASAVRDGRFRDALMLSFVSRTATDEALAAASEGAVERLFEAQPDDELLTRGTVLLAAAARTAAPGDRGDVLAVLAWAAWYQGDGARARLLAARALADRPAQTLAALVDQLLIVGVSPGWVRGAPSGASGG